MKLNAIAAGALVLAMASSAFATIQTGLTGNGSLVAVAYDATDKATFVFDTGLRTNDITANPTGNLSFNFGSSANWQSFLSLAGANDIQWTVFSNNNVASTSNYKILTTAAAGTTNTTGGNSVNSYFPSAAGGPNPWLTAINSVVDPATNTAFTTVAVNGTAYDFGSQVDSGAFGTSFNGNVKFETTASLGTAQSFYQLTRNGTANLTKINVTGLGVNANNPAGADQTGQWLLAASGALTYTATPVATVPEPESLALSLTGIAAIGFMAWRRRSV